MLEVFTIGILSILAIVIFCQFWRLLWRNFSPAPEPKALFIFGLPVIAGFFLHSAVLLGWLKQVPDVLKALTFVLQCVSVTYNASFCLVLLTLLIKRAMPVKPSTQTKAVPAPPAPAVRPGSQALREALEDTCTELYRASQQLGDKDHGKIGVVCSSMSVLLRQRRLSEAKLGEYHSVFRHALRLTENFTERKRQETEDILARLLSSIESDLRESRTDISQVKIYAAPESAVEDSVSYPASDSQWPALSTLRELLVQVKDSDGNVSMLVENIIANVEALKLKDVSNELHYAESVNRYLNWATKLTQSYIDIQDYAEPEFEHARSMAQANLVVCRDEINNLLMNFAHTARANILGINEVLHGDDLEKLRQI